MISPRYFREIPRRYRLEASRCDNCGSIHFPPRLVCPKCQGQRFSAVNLRDEGTLVTYTIIRVASEKFARETPFAVGIVELEGGVRITAQLTDVDLKKLKIGDPVKLEFRRIQEDGKSGILCYGYKATPAKAAT